MNYVTIFSVDQKKYEVMKIEIYSGSFRKGFHVIGTSLTESEAWDIANDHKTGIKYGKNKHN